METKNTRFYHTKAIVRRRRNKVTMLYDHVGAWLEDKDELLATVSDFFRNLFTKKDLLHIPMEIDRRFQPILEANHKFLISLFHLTRLKEPYLTWEP